MTAAPERILVIGAGVIGLNCAIALRKTGAAVTVIDERGPGEGTSFGNAGCIAIAEILPISTPGLIWDVPRMLLDPLGPLSIRWSYLPRLAPWLWRFWLAGGRERVARLTGVLASLTGRSWEDWRLVADEAGISHLIQQRGSLVVYDTDKGFAGAAGEWAARADYGIRFEKLGGNELRELEPALSPHYRHGYLINDWGHVADPYRIVTGLADHFLAQGGIILRGRVADFRRQDEKPVAALVAGAPEIAFDRVVIAAGAWSKPLCARLGLDVPLDTERGYNTTLAEPGIAVSRPITSAEGSFVATPMEMGLRIGGAVELAGLEAPANFQRSRALLELGRRMLPGLNMASGKEWMGFRPSMPDSLPVIGVSPRDRNVLLAFGHGHLGLTEGATTGRLIAALATGMPTVIDIKPFRVNRRFTGAD